MAKISNIIALEDKMTPTLSKIEKDAINQIKTFETYSKSVDTIKKSLEAVEKANPKIVGSEVYSQAAQALEKMEGKLYDVANGNDKFNQELDETAQKTNKLSSAITTLVGWAAVIKGAKGLMELSDTATQSKARLDMMNDSLQTTEQLQNMVYQSAQRSRVSYQSMVDTVAKLGNQAGEAFGNNNKQVIEFTELLNKLFTTAGLDATSIQSTMYNLTQSLSTGKLLGQDYRILKMNAPQILEYLRKFYGDISQAQLDELVTKGQVSAQDLKNAMFKASDEINDKFKKMPITFSQAWTKFKNSFTKILEPVAKMLSTVAEWLDKIFTFLSENQYIIYIVAGAIGVIVTQILLYNTVTSIAATVTALFTGAISALHLACIGLVVVIGAVAGYLIYLWNTNDEAAYNMMYAWDTLHVGMKKVGVGLKTIWYGIATLIESVAATVLITIQGLINGVLLAINGFITAANMIPGVDIATMEYKSFGTSALDTVANRVQDRASDIASGIQEVTDLENELNTTRADRVANRKKVGVGIGSDVGSAVSNALSDWSDDITGNDTTGGKAVKTTTDDKLISDEDIQLLLDVATRDYKLTYQQVTPNITLTFGDIRETADVDDILDQVADRLEEIYDGNLEVG